MSNIEDKIKELASRNPKSSFGQKVAERNANKSWLNKSVEIALRILDALDSPLGWNQKRLADELGVSPQQVSKIVKGSENFTIETLVKIEEVLDINLVTVLQEDELVVKKEVHDNYRSSHFSYKILMGQAKYTYDNKTSQQSEYCKKVA